LTCGKVKQLWETTSLSISRLSIAVALTALMLTPDRSGDTATLEILGFSEDGKIFAFEEYGVQDGSGFPYANRFYIDTWTDKFLPNTPVRVRLEDEQATVDAVRDEAETKAQSIISDDILRQNRGYTVGLNSVTELSADPHRLAVNPRPVIPPIDAPLELRLEEKVIDAPENCALFGPRIGLRLLRIGTEAGAETQLLHDDQSVPSSRGCPLGYQLAGVQTFFPEGGNPVYAVIIAVRAGGFEGPDHRYLAVTGRL